MLSPKYIALALVASVWALPFKREVPQEHSHEIVLESVQPMLALNNPDDIVDPVFGLLGDAAAAAGAGSVTDVACLQQATADQAFTNAKAAGNTTGMVFALIYRALERNTASVGAVSETCNQTAVNPEIAAISQHQDPASSNATAINKAIELELAKQIASVGGDPTLALKSGTFAPGQIGDPTAKGNTCDDANDTEGCIFTQNLLVDDATEDEINAAVAGISATAASPTATAAAEDDSTAASGTPATVAATATSAASATLNVAAVSTATATAAAASGSNLQTFTGALGGITAPAVTTGGRGFVVEGESGDSFLNVAAALQRSCSVQHNDCADSANGGGQSFTVSDCDQQNTECVAASD